VFGSSAKINFFKLKNERENAQKNLNLYRGQCFTLQWNHARHKSCQYDSADI